MIAHVWLVPALPLLAAILVSAAGQRSARLAGSITTGAVFFSLIMALNVLAGLISTPGVGQVSMVWLRSAGNLSMELGMLVDPLSVIMLVIVFIVSFSLQTLTQWLESSISYGNLNLSFISEALDFSVERQPPNVMQI